MQVIKNRYINLLAELIQLSGIVRQGSKIWQLSIFHFFEAPIGAKC